MNASTAESSSCTDCQGLTGASMQPTRAHPYLVFSGTSRVTGAREFLCVLCRSTFSFETPHAGVTAPAGQYAVVGASGSQEASEDYAGELHHQQQRPVPSEGTGGQA